MKNQSVFKTEEGKNAILKVYDSVLERWPVPFETANIPTRCGNTFIIACGKITSPPLILLHGTSSNSSMWVGDVAELSHSYRVYALDIPGEPGRSEAIKHPLDTQAYAEWLEDIISALGIKKASLIGCSFGGWMAIKFAAAMPDRVEKLVLLCPSGVTMQKLSFLLQALPFMFLGEWGVDRISKIVFGSSSIPYEVLQYSRLIAKNFYLRTVIPVFSDGELKRLSMPTLLLAGEKDVLLNSQKTEARLKRLLPSLTTKVLPDTGHVLINMTGQIMSFLMSGKHN